VDCLVCDDCVPLSLESSLVPSVGTFRNLLANNVLAQWAQSLRTFSWLILTPRAYALDRPRRAASMSQVSCHEAANRVRQLWVDSGIPRRACHVQFALATGCRAGEILGLEWSRVDLAIASS
jgi:integrase